MLPEDGILILTQVSATSVIFSYTVLSCHNTSSILIYKYTEWTTQKYSFLCINGLSDMSVAETVQHQMRKKWSWHNLQHHPGICKNSEKTQKKKKYSHGSQSCSQTLHWAPSEHKSKTPVLAPAHPKITDVSHDFPAYSARRSPQVTVNLIL